MRRSVPSVCSVVPHRLAVIARSATHTVLDRENMFGGPFAAPPRVPRGAPGAKFGFRGLVSSLLGVGFLPKSHRPRRGAKPRLAPMIRFDPPPKKRDESILCHAIVLPGGKSAFRAGFWPDCYRESTGIGRRPAEAGRRADSGTSPVAVRPTSGPEGRFTARKYYCVT